MADPDWIDHSFPIVVANFRSPGKYIYNVYNLVWTTVR